MKVTCISHEFRSVLVDIVKESRILGLKTTKTHILKLVYLVEVEFYRECGHRLTEVEWVYYKYGPYVFNYDEYFDGKCLSIIPPFEDFSVIDFNDLCEVSEISSYTRRIIKKVVSKYGEYPLSNLLDVVYYDTEPMLNVDKRLEKLDFSSIQACVKLRKNIVVADGTVTNSVRKAKELFSNAIKL